MDIEPAGHFTVDALVSDASVDDYDVVRGRRVTSWPSIRTDLRNAGADVVDEELVVDEQLMTSRSPTDLKAFCPGIVEHFAKSGARAGVA
jgi:protease I